METFYAIVQGNEKGKFVRKYTGKIYFPDRIYTDHKDIVIGDFVKCDITKDKDKFGYVHMEKCTKTDDVIPHIIGRSMYIIHKDNIAIVFEFDYCYVYIDGEKYSLYRERGNYPTVALENGYSVDTAFDYIVMVRGLSKPLHWEDNECKKNIIRHMYFISFFQNINDIGISLDKYLVIRYSNAYSSYETIHFYAYIDSLGWGELSNAHFSNDTKDNLAKQAVSIKQEIIDEIKRAHVTLKAIPLFHTPNYDEEFCFKSAEEYNPEDDPDYPDWNRYVNWRDNFIKKSITAKNAAKYSEYISLDKVLGII